MNTNTPPPPPPHRALCVYYGFLLLTTALSHGLPYPLYGAVLTGHPATAALVVDCLLLIHIVVGVARAQRLTWYLLLTYNGVNLASLLVTLAVLSPSELAALLGATELPAGFYIHIVLAVAALLLATVYTVRARERFHNSSPFLF